jgi:hypothetical protein
VKSTNPWRHDRRPVLRLRMPEQGRAKADVSFQILCQPSAVHETTIIKLGCLWQLVATKTLQYKENTQCMRDSEAKILIHNLCPKGRKHIARGEAPGRRNRKRINPEGVKEKRILLISQEILH